RPATMVGALYDGSYHVITITDDGQMKIRQRTWKHPKEVAELLKQAAGATTPPMMEVSWTDLLQIPLQNQPLPKWQAEAKLESDQLNVTVQRGDLPADCEMKVRIDTQAWQELKSTGDAWAISFPRSELVPGIHIVTARAKLKDDRAYSRPVQVKLPGKVSP